jgi:hypothetical protein
MSEPSPWTAPAPEVLPAASIEERREDVARWLAAFALVLATSEWIQHFIGVIRGPINTENAAEAVGFAFALVLTYGTKLACYVWLAVRYVVGRRRLRRGPVITGLVQILTDWGPMLLTIPRAVEKFGVEFVLFRQIFTVAPGLLLATALVTLLAGRMTRGRMVAGHIAVGLYGVLVGFSWVVFIHNHH